MLLRKVTAVATSTPWLKASRAATWLAPIISAINNKVAKAAADKAGAAWGRKDIEALSRGGNGGNGGIARHHLRR